MADPYDPLKDPRVITGNIAGVARPTEDMRRRLRFLHGNKFVDQVDKALDLERAFDDVQAIDGLAKLIERGFEKCVAKDGNLDTKDLAAFILGEMRKHQKI